MTEMLCATTSCRSRAIRIRSSPARRRNSSWRLCSSAAARWLRARMTSATASRNSSKIASPTANPALAWPGLPISQGGHIDAT